MSEWSVHRNTPKIMAALCRLAPPALKQRGIWIPLLSLSNYQGHVASFGAHSHSQLPDHSCNLRHLEHTRTETYTHIWLSSWCQICVCIPGASISPAAVLMLPFWIVCRDEERPPLGCLLGRLPKVRTWQQTGGSNSPASANQQQQFCL